MSKEYPEDPEKFPNKSTITKERITAKLKSIRTGFKKAADAGRKSGDGRAVFMFYDLCENLWGVSPAVTSLRFGVETLSNHNQSEENVFDAGEIEEALFPAYLPPVNGSTNANGSVTDYFDHFEEAEEENGEKTQSSKGRKPIDVQAFVKPVEERREAVKQMLKNRKDKKMTSKISNDDQLLQLTREDIAFKKELLEKIDKSDKEFKSELASLNHTMSNIGTAIQQSVGILAMLVNQGQRKECRNSTESTGTRATSNSEPHSSYQAVRYYPHSISTNPSNQWNTFYEDKEENESENQNTYYTFK